MLKNKFKIEYGNHILEIQINLGRLEFLNLGKWEELKIVPCFPYVSRDSYLSFQNCKGEELFLCQQIENLKGEAKALIAEELKKQSYVHQIDAVLEIKDSFELRRWKVICSGKERIIHNKQSHYPEERISGKWLLKDIYGELFEIGLDCIQKSPVRKELEILL